MINNKNAPFLYNQTSYLTCETYHALNRNCSEKYIIRSTSTLFYDLDKIAKRHSYHYVPQFSNSKIVKRNNKISNKNGFRATSEAVVQECTTQIQPKLKRLDNLKNVTKKMKKRSVNDSMLSSEIFLRDNDYTIRISDSYVKNKNDLKQKFWSYAKYRTEYTNPLPELQTCENKDQGKRTEDPCPCQLFSYACPCTDKKSLTELAKNSKSLTVADQITSTPKLLAEVESQNQKYGKINKSKYNEDKPTNSNTAGSTKKYEITAVYEEEPVTNKKDIPKNVNNKRQSCSTCVESKSRKKSKHVICPNCKETLEILSTEDEDGFKFKKYPHRRSTEKPSASENLNYKNNVDETDVCNHDPPCDLVPLCQILPTENINYSNEIPKCVRRVSLTKHNPKMIRITKACRHHPPCIVVPSCQRLNVLKNNCEYIPPCLHRPRCVNVPLCVPFSKRLNCDDILNKKTDEIDNVEGNLFPPYKFISAYQQESLNNCTNQTCEYVSEYSPRYILSPEMHCISPTFLPCPDLIQIPCKSQSNKSCQYDCIDSNCIPPTKLNEYSSSDDIIYIRDVGCQFRSDYYVPKDSLLRSKTSSASYDLTSTKPGKYYSNYHTLRYEDKCTNPISGEELSLSNFTTSSVEIDAHCPSHGIQARGQGTTGFRPQSTAPAFVTAFAYKDPNLKYAPISDEVSVVTNTSDSIDTLTYLTKLPAKSRRSFLKGKRKKVFSIRRRKKSKRNNSTLKLKK